MIKSKWVEPLQRDGYSDVLIAALNMSPTKQAMMRSVVERHSLLHKHFSHEEMVYITLVTKNVADIINHGLALMREGFSKETILLLSALSADNLERVHSLFIHGLRQTPIDAMLRGDAPQQAISRLMICRSELEQHGFDWQQIKQLFAYHEAITDVYQLVPQWCLLKTIGFTREQFIDLLQYDNQAGNLAKAVALINVLQGNDIETATIKDMMLDQSGPEAWPSKLMLLFDAMAERPWQSTLKEPPPPLTGYFRGLDEIVKRGFITPSDTPRVLEASREVASLPSFEQWQSELPAVATKPLRVVKPRMMTVSPNDVITMPVSSSSVSQGSKKHAINADPILLPCDAGSTTTSLSSSLMSKRQCIEGERYLSRKDAILFDDLHAMFSGPASQW